MGTAHNECLRVLAAKMHITVTTIADCSKELLEKTLNLWPDTKDITPEYLFLKKLYEEKKYGNLKSVIMQRISNNVNWGYQDWFHDPVRSGSVILDLHIHDIDFLRYMLGEPDYVDVQCFQI